MSEGSTRLTMPYGFRWKVLNDIERITSSRYVIPNALKDIGATVPILLCFEFLNRHPANCQYFRIYRASRLAIRQFPREGKP